jgi:hypothetical protein
MRVIFFLGTKGRRFLSLFMNDVLIMWFFFKCLVSDKC